VFGCDAATMDLEKFKLHHAVEILLDQNRPIFFRTWALARLMAWMCLDQRHGKRRRDTETGRPSGRSIRSNSERRDAKFAGHLALASLLDRRFKPGAFDENDEIFGLFFASGGFRLFLRSPRGARRWLSRMDRATQQLFYVHQIVEYLCRGEKFGLDQRKLNIECAKKFIEKTDKKPKWMDEPLKPRTIGDYWEKNKQAAPYIFAFYPFLASAVERSASIDQFVDALEQLTKNGEHLKQLLGQAAYAAQVLALKARNVRQGDFKEVHRVEPQLAAFAACEIEIIGTIEARRPLSKKDLEPYRPEPISPTKRDGINK
jgi:hypothetical protein